MKTMKKIVVFVLISFFILTGQETLFAQIDKNKEVKVEVINVQELDDNNSQAATNRAYRQRIKEFNDVVDTTFHFNPSSTLKKDKNADINMDSYGIINEDYDILKKSSINNCNDSSNLKADNYAINNKAKRINLDKKKFSSKIYRLSTKKCNLVVSISNYSVSKAIQFNSQLYFELYNSEHDDSKALYRLNKNDKLVKIKNTNQGITSFTKTDDYLLYTFDGNLYAIDANQKDRLIKNNLKNSIEAATFYKDKLYLVLYNSFNQKSYVSSYADNLSELKELKSLKQLDQKTNRELVFKKGAMINDVTFNVTNQSNQLVVFSNELVCKKDFSKCKHTFIDGESILGVVNNYIVYGSDRIYLSDFNINSKDTLMEDRRVAIGSSSHDDNDYLVMKVYNKEGKSQFIQYNLDDF